MVKRKRIERPDIAGAHCFRISESCSEEAKGVINYLLDYIYYLEMDLASRGKLSSTITGFDDVIDKETAKCMKDKCLCDGEE